MTIRALILAAWLRLLAGCFPLMLNEACCRAWWAAFFRRGVGRY